MDGIAYKSTSTAVLDAWQAYLEGWEKINAARQALADRFGRRLMISRSGFGHGTRVVGFEVFDGEADGLVIGDNGELRIPKKGPPYNTATPNIRRKAGKDLAEELGTLSTHGPDLPGMPAFVLVGFSSLAPALHFHDNAVWAMWSDDITEHAQTGGGVDYETWETVPLSAYYAAKEAHDA